MLRDQRTDRIRNYPLNEYVPIANRTISPHPTVLLRVVHRQAQCRKVIRDQIG